MKISKKIKTINNKIEQNKGQYHLGRQTANISALSSGNVSQYELLTGKNVLPEKHLPEKAATMKRLEYSRFSTKLKAKTDTAKKEYQGLDNVFISNKDNQNVNDVLFKKEKNKVKSNLQQNEFLQL